MKIVIDSNILFSALIKDSTTRKLILEYESSFLLPEFIFEEIEKHKRILLEKSNMEEKEFNALLEIIVKKVNIISKVILNRYYNEAYEIVKNIDINDVLFFACALADQPSIIWSDDKKLKNQNKILVFNTKEIIDLIKQ